VSAILANGPLPTAPVGAPTSTLPWDPGYAGAVSSKAAASVPVPIRLIAWFELIGGGFAILNGLFLLSRGGWLLIVAGIVAVAGGIGLLLSKLWGYVTVLAIAAVMIVLASPLLSLGQRTDLFTLIVNVVVLLVLLTRGSLVWASSLRTPVREHGSDRPPPGGPR
jgi:hypothetical protein